MTFDRLVYIDRLKGAGVAEDVARAHAEALRDALMDTVATKADLADAVRGIDRKLDEMDRKIEITARNLTIRGAGGVGLIVSLLIALKVSG